MKSTAKLARENNVKSLRLNNTDREIFENYMTYIALIYASIRMTVR